MAQNNFAAELSTYGKDVGLLCKSCTSEGPAVAEQQASRRMETEGQLSPGITDLLLHLSFSASTDPALMPPNQNAGDLRWFQNCAS